MDALFGPRDPNRFQELQENAQREFDARIEKHTRDIEEEERIKALASANTKNDKVCLRF